MIIIVEGLDGVGKTTFCNKFVDEFDWEYVKGTMPRNFDEKIEVLKKLLEQVASEENYIYDRIPLIDDFVYHFLDGATSDLDEIFPIIKLVLSKCLIIHLTVPENVRKQRFDSRGDEYVLNEQMPMIMDNYLQFYSKLECPIILYPLSDNLDNDIIKINKIVESALW